VNAVLRAVDHVGSRWWFGDGFVLALCTGVLLVATLLDPTHEAVSWFGVEIPVVCTFRRLTGIGCPGCGLTRSFAFMGHLQLVDAFRVNLLGPLLYLGVAAQVPWRAVRLLRARARRSA